MRPVTPTYTYQSPAHAAQVFELERQNLVALRQKLKDTKRELKDALGLIDRLGQISADARYRRLQRFELMEELIAHFLDGEDEDEDEDDE